MPRSQKHKKDSQIKQIFVLVGSARRKAEHKHVDEIGPWRQSYEINLVAKKTYQFFQFTTME